MDLYANFPSHENLSCSTEVEPSIGELRFIARLNKKVLPDGHIAAEVNGGSMVEGKDVFLVNDQTRSKCWPLFIILPNFNTYPPPVYSSKQFIDDQVHGVRGSGIGTFASLPPKPYPG